MLVGTVHACGIDPNGVEWDFDRELGRPVALVPDDLARAYVQGSPDLYGYHPADSASAVVVPPSSPRRGGRPRKEATP